MTIKIKKILTIKHFFIFLMMLVKKDNMYKNELIESMKELKKLELMQYDFFSHTYLAFEELAFKIKKLFSQIIHNTSLIVEYFSSFPHDEKLLKFVHGDDIVEQMKPIVEKHQLEKKIKNVHIKNENIKL
jgi:hypothetical protein